MTGDMKIVPALFQAEIAGLPGNSVRSHRSSLMLRDQLPDAAGQRRIGYFITADRSDVVSSASHILAIFRIRSLFLRGIFLSEAT